ncbi:kinetochore Sim4 complex subunit FTA2-domain-containing protein [Xylariaceae sp. FL1272]|nr:kinetochore Sim4 complex subunit FTA2-domain-containing protein [Xylariaceae sp. FL1272]
MSSSCLPSVIGPRLGPFDGDVTSIQFQKLLNNPGSSSSTDSEVPHGQVFKVSLVGQTFALKVFNFFSLDELRPWLPFTGHLLKDEWIRYQLDPFYAECRAFGLLVEKGRDDELAVRCYGYVFLPPAVERQIEQQFGIDGWNRKPEDEGTPLRAIVKDFIRWKTVQHRRKLPAMRKILQVLNKELGIYNMDIREQNYLGGRLFDFSIAITMPHICLSDRLYPREQVLDNMRDDIGCFDSMVGRIQSKKKEAEEENPSWKQRTRSAKSLA